MEEINKLGLELFKNEENFKLWLDTPNFALGNVKPIDLLNTPKGKELLIGALTRISHGIFV